MRIDELFDDEEEEEDEEEKSKQGRRGKIFHEEVRLLIDKLYSLCSDHDISLLCSSAYKRNERDDGKFVWIDFDGYTVATGRMEMMPEHMLAMAGILNPEFLKYISKRMTEVMKKLDDRQKNGEILENTQLTEEEQEYLRMGEIFARYADALKLAGPYGYRRTENGYKMLEVPVSPEDLIDDEDDKEDEEDDGDDGDEGDNEEGKMDSSLENDLRNLLN